MIELVLSFLLRPVTTFSFSLLTDLYITSFVLSFSWQICCQMWVRRTCSFRQDDDSMFHLFRGLFTLQKFKTTISKLGKFYDLIHETFVVFVERVEQMYKKIVI